MKESCRLCAALALSQAVGYRRGPEMAKTVSRDMEKGGSWFKLY